MTQVSFCGKETAAIDHAHHHADYELLYVRSGWMEVQVSGKLLHAGAPALVFLGALENHRVVAASEDYERFVLTIPAPQLKDVPPVLTSVFRSRPADFCHVLPASDCAETLNALMQAMVQECETGDIHSRMCVQSLVKLMLVHLHRLHPEAFPAARLDYPDHIIQAQRYLDEHFREPLSIDGVARRFFMSPSTFRHVFHTLIGYSPRQYITLSRLAAARELLCTTRLPVSEIAAQCGFGDPSNFVRRFRQHYGQSPSALRKEA